MTRIVGFREEPDQPSRRAVRKRQRAEMAAWLERQPTVCPICCESAASEVHHIIPKRMGGNRKAECPENWLRICQNCHRNIHAYKYPPAVVLRAKKDVGDWCHEVLEDIAGHALPKLVEVLQ